MQSPCRLGGRSAQRHQSRYRLLHPSYRRRLAPDRYCIAFIFIVVAFLPKVSALLSTLPGPVMTGYLIMVTGTLFVDGASTVIQVSRTGKR